VSSCGAAKNQPFDSSGQAGFDGEFRFGEYGTRCAEALLEKKGEELQQSELRRTYLAIP
jgi:hypothetical protein